MTDELQFFRDEVLGELGYSDEDSETDPLEYARREIGKLQKRNKDMAHEIQELRKLRAENEALRSALISMCDQYLTDILEAIELLEDLNLISGNDRDGYYWITKGGE